METNLERIRRIMLATTRMDGAYYFFAKTLGLKENTLLLLYALNDGKPHSQKEICTDWQIPKTTVSTVVKELKHRGYVTLSSREGSREKNILLTAEGIAYSEKIMESVYEAERIAMESTLDKYSPEFVDAIDYFSHCIKDEIQKRLTQNRGDK